jgi:hypothetical protein
MFEILELVPPVPEPPGLAGIATVNCVVVGTDVTITTPL